MLTSETEALHSSIRASAAMQKLKDAPPASGTAGVKSTESGEIGTAGGRGATETFHIDFAVHLHVTEGEERQTGGRADILTSLAVYNAAERRAHARAKPASDTNAKCFADLDIPPVTASKRRASEDARNKDRLMRIRAGFEDFEATINAHATHPLSHCL